MCRSVRPSSQILLLTCLLARLHYSHTLPTYTYTIFFLLYTVVYITNFLCCFYLTDTLFSPSRPMNFNPWPKLTFGLNHYPDRQLCNMAPWKSAKILAMKYRERKDLTDPKAAIVGSEFSSFSLCQKLLVYVSAPVEHDLLPSHCSHFNMIDLLIKFK